MIRYFFLLVIGVAACDPGGVIVPKPEELPTADPGIRLPFAAPEDDGMFPQIAWDTNAGLFLPDRPNVSPTTLVRFELETGATTPLERVDGNLQVVAGGGGSVFYTQSMSSSDVLFRAGGVNVGPVSAVQFAVSRDGKWIVVRDKGWWVLDVESGARRPIPAVPEFRQPIAIDNDGNRMVFGIVGPLSEFDPGVTLVDVAAATTRAIPIPGNRLLAAEFTGGQPLLFGFASVDKGTATELRFLTRTEVEGSTRVVGTVQAGTRDNFLGVCGAWSAEGGYGVGVVQVRFSGAVHERHQIVKLDTAARVIGTADLLAPTDCTVSPDGKWFVYGNSTGYIGNGELYLKAVR